MRRCSARPTTWAVVLTSMVLACTTVHRPAPPHSARSVAPSPTMVKIKAAGDGQPPPAPALDSLDLGYDPLEAQYVDRLGYTYWLRFGKSAKARLATRGIVALPVHNGYATGLSDIFKADLPVWITADAILHALHWSHAETMGLFESQVLAPALIRILDKARASTRFLPTDRATKADVDVYLTVAASLARGKNMPCVAGGDTQAAWRIISEILRADGSSSFTLFGRTAVQQLEAYAVHGHYLKEVELQRFYRVRKWLSRTALPLVEVRDGTTHVNRDLFAVAQLLSKLVLSSSRGDYQRMTQAESALVGPPALLGPLDLSNLTVHGIGNSGATDASDSAVLLDALERSTGTRPSRPGAGAWVEFALSGRRQVPEDVVTQLYVSQPPQRVVDANDAPIAEQIGYAVLGHDRALSWSTDDARRMGQLRAARASVDARFAERGVRSSYWTWMGALRKLRDPLPAASPGARLAGTEDWSRRMLNTQLAGWTVARRDSSLYLEPARVFISCEFPDAFVDPYPAFWDALRAWIVQVRESVTRHKLSGNKARRVLSWTQDAEEIVARLGDIARRQALGDPIRDVDLAWLNEMVQIDPVDCAGTVRTASGWYTKLFVDPSQAVMPGYSAAPIAQLGQEHAGERAWLHATVGPPHAVAIAIDGPHKPRVFVGMVATYQSFLADRVMDEQTWYKEGWSQAETPDWYAPLYEGPTEP